MMPYRLIVRINNFPEYADTIGLLQTSYKEQESCDFAQVYFLDGREGFVADPTEAERVVREVLYWGEFHRFENFVMNPRYFGAVPRMGPPVDLFGTGTARRSLVINFKEGIAPLVLNDEQADRFVDFARGQGWM